MSSSNGFAGVSNCYAFKSRLQEYAQKEKILNPVYETIKEGPSHEPSFRSSVIVNDVRYDSLLGFSSRKAAEQSAAEIALIELAKAGKANQCISDPVQDTGLCKNLIQEYAQKMNYAVPSYVCQKDVTPGRPPFSCTVTVGGIQYIGAAARTKKEAEIKAARTALLALKLDTPGPEAQANSNSLYTVLPSKKRPAESPTPGNEITKRVKSRKTRKTAKKPHSPNKPPKWRYFKNKNSVQDNNPTEKVVGNKENAPGDQNGGSDQVVINGSGWLGTETNQNVVPL